MLLAIAMNAVAGLTVAVVILAGDNSVGTTATPTAERGAAFRVPWYAIDHGGAPVPDLRVKPLPNSRRYDG